MISIQRDTNIMHVGTYYRCPDVRHRVSILHLNSFFGATTISKRKRGSAHAEIAKSVTGIIFFHFFRKLL
jgi:hypothetical protein